MLTGPALGHMLSPSTTLNEEEGDHTPFCIGVLEFCFSEKSPRENCLLSRLYLTTHPKAWQLKITAIIISSSLCADNLGVAS